MKKQASWGQCRRWSTLVKQSPPKAWRYRRRNLKKSQLTPARTHARPPARPHARPHACTHAWTHARTRTHAGGNSLVPRAAIEPHTADPNRPTLVAPDNAPNHESMLSYKADQGLRNAHRQAEWTPLWNLMPLPHSTNPICHHQSNFHRCSLFHADYRRLPSTGVNHRPL